MVLFHKYFIALCMFFKANSQIKPWRPFCCIVYA